jgi:6-pyruvoyltetrahydropterin/6-carboxytetrahydropterin synthase
VLDGALRALADLLDDADLDRVVGPETPAEAVTVEVFARWVHGRLAATIGPIPGATLGVRVWESPVAFGGYTAALADPPSSA